MRPGRSPWSLFGRGFMLKDTDEGWQQHSDWILLSPKDEGICEDWRPDDEILYIIRVSLPSPLSWPPATPPTHSRNTGFGPSGYRPEIGNPGLGIREAQRSCQPAIRPHQRSVPMRIKTITLPVILFISTTSFHRAQLGLPCPLLS